MIDEIESQNEYFSRDERSCESVIAVAVLGLVLMLATPSRRERTHATIQH
jgi:hypothetical protein